MNSHIFVFKEKYVKYSLNKIGGGGQKKAFILVEFFVKMCLKSAHK